MPNSANSHMGNPNFVAHRSGRPVRRSFRSGFQCRMEQFSYLFIQNRARTTWSELVMQTFKAFLRISLSPLSNRRTRQTNFLTNLLIAETIGSKKNNSEAHAH